MPLLARPPGHTFPAARSDGAVRSYRPPPFPHPYPRWSPRPGTHRTPRLRSRPSRTGSGKKPERGFSSPARLAQRVGRGDRGRWGWKKGGREGGWPRVLPHTGLRRGFPLPFAPTFPTHSLPTHIKQPRGVGGNTLFRGGPSFGTPPSGRAAGRGPAGGGNSGSEPKEGGIGSGA